MNVFILMPSTKAKIPQFAIKRLTRTLFSIIYHKIIIKSMNMPWYYFGQDCGWDKLPIVEQSPQTN